MGSVEDLRNKRMKRKGERESGYGQGRTRGGFLR
jgi:hypothetical protein